MVLPGATPELLGHGVLSVVPIVLLGVLALWIHREGGKIDGIRTLLALIVLALFWQLQLLGIVLFSDPTILQVLSISEKLTGYLSAPVWLVFISQYTNTGFHERRWFRALFVAQFALLLVPLPFESTRGLVIREFMLHPQPFLHTGIDRGPLYLFAMAITYTADSIGLLVLARFLLRTRRSAWPRVALLTVGVFSVGVLNLLSVAGLGPAPGFNYGGYAALPFVLATTIAVVRFRLLDIVPVARNTLVESLDDPVVVVDEDRHLIDYNRRATELCPALSEAEGEPLETVWPALAEQVQLPVTDPDDERIVLDVDGDTRYFSLLASPVGDSATETPLGYSLLLRDVTELEASRRRLSEQNDRLDQVASTISHDLRNPLNVAWGYLQLVEADNEETVYEIEESLDRMDSIIEDVLTLARQGGSIGETEPVDLETVATDAWEHVETASATLVVETDVRLEADPDRLLQLLENLFRNAREHGGADVIVTVDAVDDRFYVEDDGPGIPDDEREQVLETGYSTTDEGTGFGLAIVSEIADGHDWTVTVTEGSSGGARFEFHGIDRPIPAE